VTGIQPIIDNYEKERAEIKEDEYSPRAKDLQILQTTHKFCELLNFPGRVDLSAEHKAPDRYHS
jgi:hypothetical protein